LPEGRGSGLRDPLIMLRRVGRNGDGAHNMAIEDERQAALHLHEPRCCDGGDAAVVDRLFERRLRRLPMGCGGTRLCRRQLDARGHRRIIYALQRDQPAAVIEHRHHTSHPAALCFHLRRRDDARLASSSVRTLFYTACAAPDRVSAPEHKSMSARA